MRWGPLLAWMLLGCAEPQKPRVDDCGTGEPTRVQLIHKLSFARPSAQQVTSGFDLDGVVTAPGSGSGCGVDDFMGSDGSLGIDSAFAYLLPALELTEAQAVEGLIQANINNGELLLLLEFHDLDDPVEDSCAQLDVVRAAGVPDVGTDDFILSGQTFDRDEHSPATRMLGVTVEQGIAVATDFELSLPVQIFDVHLDFELHGGAIAVEFADDGGARGYFAGGVKLDDILQVTQEENVDPAIQGLISPLLEQWSDLAPDASGSCRQISITFEFEAVSAFIYADSPELDFE